MTALPDPSRPLDPGAIADAIEAMLEGTVPDDRIAAFLLALAERGETPGEIAAAAGVLRRHMLPVSAPEGAIDVCGTGGDGAHSLNISTAVGFVVAAAGVPVAKHGNRAASSRSGAADVLEALGWKAGLAPDRLERCLDDVGIVFLHAQQHHPAMARVAPVRRSLGRRTIFNLLGPLANPAGVKRQMLGVFAPHWLAPMAEAGVRLGADAMLTVHGGGLDEIAVHAPSRLVWQQGEQRTDETFEPDRLGLGPHAAEALAGGTPEENAEALRALFEGRGRPAYHAIVVANAAAALRLAGRAKGWPEAIAIATKALSSGAAADRLARFLSFR
ncbi:anthranilate phosphoribosyltransferase [Sandaracinobacteroides sp. A072]|uniref:anthranilate phosphoribosyltransferase n=1 Tax=Sandaracinobacteroides sp. A072 TaxID=3461146 RepID=UPI00404159DB